MPSYFVDILFTKLQSPDVVFLTRFLQELYILYNMGAIYYHLQFSKYYPCYQYILRIFFIFRGVYSFHFKSFKRTNIDMSCRWIFLCVKSWMLTGHSFDFYQCNRFCQFFFLSLWRFNA